MSQSGPPEGLEGQVGDRGAGSEVQVLQLWAELTEAVTRAAREGTHTHTQFYSTLQVKYSLGITFFERSNTLIQVSTLLCNWQFQGCKKRLLFQVNMLPITAEIEEYFTSCLALVLQSPPMQSPRVTSLCTCP